MLADVVPQARDSLGVVAMATVEVTYGSGSSAPSDWCSWRRRIGWSARPCSGWQSDCPDRAARQDGRIGQARAGSSRTRS